MRISNLSFSLVLSVVTFLPSTKAIFADEAYHIDYQHQLLGLPQPHSTFFHRPRKEEKASLLYTLSEKGILGAVNPGTGAIVWRQQLEATSRELPGGSKEIHGFLRAAEGEGTLVSAVEGSVHAWNAVTGRQIWNNHFDGVAKDVEVMETASDEAHKDALVLFEQPGKGILRKLNGRTGDVVWEYTLLGADVPFQVGTNVRNIFVVSLHGARGGYNLRVTTLDPLTGKKVDDHVLQSKSDIHQAEDVLFVGANVAAPIIAWTDAARKTLKINILGTTQISSFNLATSNGEVERVTIHAPHLVQSQPHFLVHSQSSTSHWAEVYHINIGAGTVKEAYHLPNLPGKGAFSTSSQDANVYFTRHTEDEVVVVASTSHGVLGRWPLDAKGGAGSALHGVSEVVSKPGNTYAVRSAIVSTEDNWDMIRNGAFAWRRNEGLAGAIAAAWTDIPEQKDLAKTLEAEAHSSPLAAYIHRVNRHLNDLQYLPGYLQSLPMRFLSSILPKDSAKAENEPLVRDNFGFHKLVIVATERGRLLALDAGEHGRIIWSRRVVELPAGKYWNVKGILVNGIEGTVSVKDTKGGEITVQTTSGDIVETVPGDSLSSVQSTVLVDSQSGQWFLSIGADGSPLPFKEDLNPKDIIVVRNAQGEVKGLQFEKKDGKFIQNEVWSFHPPVGQRITSITSRPAHDPVASIGTVLGDRTVLYKYLNPNTILVTAVSEVALSASFYLLDSVSGDVLYSTTHDSVDLAQPITSLLTENWFVYSLWSDIGKNATLAQSYKGYQLVVSDLYESSLANDRGPLGAVANSSSLEPSEDPSAEPVLPHVISQAFIVPEAISNMAVTQTKQGIASRQLLCTLAMSNAIIGITRNILDPRRPVGRDPTPGEMEEGLMKYSPVIEFDPKMMLTHQREVMGVRNVITSPSLLESTTLVFAYGLDVFGTRVTPSLAFDILGKDFNRLALVFTVTALAAGVGFLAPMVSLLNREVDAC